jgi:hypothetical protein
MGFTIELQNLGDAQLCREITAHLEHAFSDRKGDWRVSISGSRAAESWICEWKDHMDSNGLIRSQALLESMSLRPSARWFSSSCHQSKRDCGSRSSGFGIDFLWQRRRLIH